MSPISDLSALQPPRRGRSIDQECLLDRLRHAPQLRVDVGERERPAKSPLQPGYQFACAQLTRFGRALPPAATLCVVVPGNSNSSSQPECVPMM
jgi:hypothetical protein